MAIVDETSSIDFAELVILIKKINGFLVDLGIKRNDVVGIHIKNEKDHLILSLALFCLGTKQVTLASHDSTFLHHQINDRLLLDCVISDAHEKILNLPTYFYSLEIINGKYIHHDIGNEGRLFLKTSGTTGAINIVEFTEEAMSLQSQRHSDYSKERLLRLASIEHNNSKRHRLYCVWNGGTNVFKPPKQFNVIEFILKHNVTCLDISRMHISDLLTKPDVNLLNTIKIRTGGSAIPYTLRKNVIEKITKDFYVRYAATECGGISMANPDNHNAHESSGLPLNHVWVEIVDKEHQPLSQGQVGELRIKAPGMASEYFNDEKLTQEKFIAGYFYPGDIGYISESGELILKGRRDDMLNLNGLNIYPIEIENVLESHPAVLYAAAFPIDSLIHGQIPVAAVQLKKNDTTNKNELTLFAKKVLGLRAPRNIYILDEIPRNAQGKILKKSILSMISASKPLHE